MREKRKESQVGVRWVIGRAGTGKTARCVAEMRDAMRRQALAGGALLLITPEQATFSAERTLLSATGAGVGDVVRGTVRAQVLSFRRLAMVMAREAGLFGGAGRAVAKPMDRVARVVLLEETVRRHRGELNVFGAVADRPGFIRKLDATLRELRAQGHSGTSLRGVVEGEQEGVPVDAMTGRKLLDLSVLLDAWSREVDSAESWDSEYLMHAVALKADKSPLVAGTGAEKKDAAAIWVDGFSAMSGLELRLMAALAKHAGRMTITLLADPDGPMLQAMRPEKSDAAHGEGGGGGVFARTERLHRRLTESFMRHQVAIEKTEALRTVHRFAAPALEKIETELFAEGERRPETVPTPAAKKKEGRHVAAQRSLFDDAPGEAPVERAVEIWESSDPETEVRVAAQAIRDLVIPPADAGAPTPLRYRQIGVIIPDLEGYHDAVRRIFAEHHIPHFIDLRRGIAHHPLVELVRSAVAIATNRWDRDDLLLYLKSRLAGVADDDVSLVENYMIEHGITHAPWSTEWKWVERNLTLDDVDGRVPTSALERLSRVNAVRAKVNADLEPWVAAVTAAAGSADAAAFVRALRSLLKSLNTDMALQGWIDSAARSKDAELSQVHAQVWREVEQLLALLETILAGKTRTLEEFERVLSTALESLTLGLIPPTVDQVLVSSVTRSHVPAMEVVMILGALEGQFPKVVEEDVILSDAQRGAFNALAASPIEEGSDRKLLEMPFFDYVALTRACRRLVVSYPLANRQGKSVGKSRYVQRLRDLLESDIGERQFDAGSRTDIERIGTADDLLAGVAAWAREEVRRSEGGAVSTGEKQSAAAARMEALYNWLTRHAPEDWYRAMRIIWEPVRGKPAPALAPDLAAIFYPPESPLFMSVSQLEKFAACPLQYFMHYTLRLRPRQEFALDSMDVGTLHHSILERVYRRIIAEEIPWPHCAAASLRAPLEAEVDAAIEELHREVAQREPGYEKTRARIKRVLAVILEADRRRACASAMRPRDVEVTFGRGGGAAPGEPRTVPLKVLKIETPHKHTVHVNGKIDRLDVSDDGDEEVSVVDYKTTPHRSLELYRVLWGLTLQLPAYAVAQHELVGRRPVAAYYLPLMIKPERVTHAGEADPPDSDAFYQQFKPRGIFDRASVWRLDCNFESAGRSDWYKLSLNKDGTPAKTSDLLTHDDFDTVLAYTRQKIATLADDLMAGKIAPDPYRKKHESPCTDCAFASLCPFDRVTGIYREVPARISNSDALAEMKRVLS